MKIQDEFERIANDTGFGGVMPPGARKALRQMKAIIDDSDNPADVSMAVCMGLSYALLTSKDENLTIEVILATSLKLKEQLQELHDKYKDKLKGGLV